jgi:hypothetical protein
MRFHQQTPEKLIFQTAGIGSAMIIILPNISMLSYKDTKQAVYHALNKSGVLFWYCS